MINNTFLVGNYAHSPNDLRCGECWSNYPKKCECEGLIHAQFVKENWEGELSLVFLCDSCGEDYKQWVPKIKPKRHKPTGKSFGINRSRKK